ncbi:guanine nucleotide-binding protein subunit beta-2-like 1 [Dorcoceras hygrometricum]|uniref:Guanine nucleotide-binding protein subunit beta-2-like 1 n=1 Tax=Dorcoceras hygrometricum TaxID=472368 RepID=A0A2Z7CGZ4_9LAMI|nr:guanine nucleotide-binding protein subunit beta-2-like 1 [Dorcoceras hygrometricum]
MDAYKAVTGGPDDPYVSVWDVGTGARSNSLSRSSFDDPSRRFGCLAMAVDGRQIVLLAVMMNCAFTAPGLQFCYPSCFLEEWEQSSAGSKFWNPQSQSLSDSEEPDW